MVNHASRRRAGIIERFGCLFGAMVQGGIVMRLIDANTPDDDGRMVPVAAHHISYIAHREVPPILTTEILPAGKIFWPLKALLTKSSDF